MFFPKRLSACVCLVLLSLFSDSHPLAQCKAPTLNENGFYGWEPGRLNAPHIVYFDLTGVTAGEAWKDQIRLALNDWNTANQKNGSYVKFEERSDAGDSKHSIKFSTSWPADVPARRIG